jgi:hypothetical protein
MSEVYEIIGATASPFSVKMRAIMRYRRIPHVWRLRHANMQTELAPIKPPVMPYLRYPDGTLHNDTTLLAYDLEQRYAEKRSIVPPDPGLAFLSHLIEDMADEWGTRIMAFYRWNHEADRAFVTHWAASEMFRGNSKADQDKASEGFRKRQTERLDVLGAHPDNRAILEQTYRSVLSALTSIKVTPGFLFGSRPALADFGWFGQLYQCAMDPTASAIMRKSFPDVFIWLHWLDDASGIDGTWCEDVDHLPEPTREMLGLVGNYYLPYLAANAAAADRGEEIMDISLQGNSIRQQMSRYQVKCLDWLREEWAAMSLTDRKKITSILVETNCIGFFDENAGTR